MQLHCISFAPWLDLALSQFEHPLEVFQKFSVFKFISQQQHFQYCSKFFQFFCVFHSRLQTGLIDVVTEHLWLYLTHFNDYMQ